MAVAETIAFPFSDLQLSSSLFSETDLGRGINDKNGELTAPIFLFPEGQKESTKLRHFNVPGERVSEKYQIEKNAQSRNDFMKIDGSLEIHYGLLGGKGSGKFEKKNENNTTSVSILQKCTKIVGTSEINLGALATVMAGSEKSRTPFLNAELKDPEKAAQLIDAQGSRFVHKLILGGVAFRRITYSFKDIKDITEMKANIEGKIKVGLFDIKFDASFEKKDGTKSSEMDIGVETIAVGGDIGKFKFTKDPDVAMEQLEAWKQTVVLSRDEFNPSSADTENTITAAMKTRVKNRAAIIQVKLQKLSGTYVPMLRWKDEDIKEYTNNIVEARQAKWKYKSKQVHLHSLIEKIDHQMKAAGMANGARGEILNPVKDQASDLDQQYFHHHAKKINQYLAQSAEEIRSSQYEGPTKTPQMNKLAEVLIGLTGGRTQTVDIKVGMAGQNIVKVKWDGPYCSAIDKDGILVGPFGAPEEIVFMRPDSWGKQRRPVPLLRIPSSGWDIKRAIVLTGKDAVVYMEDQMEGSDNVQNVQNIPKGLEQYSGKMEYEDTSQYKGQWVKGKRHGYGTHSYQNGDEYVGAWLQDKWNGKGTLTDNLGYIFSGVFADGAKHGEGELTAPKKKGNQKGGDEFDCIQGEWEHDLFVITSHKYEDAIKIVDKLPVHYRQKWIGKNIGYPNGGYYTGEYSLDFKRHGEGIMVSVDGTKDEGPWLNDESAQAAQAEKQRKVFFNPEQFYGFENVKFPGFFMNVQAGFTGDGATMQLYANPGSQDSQWRLVTNKWGANEKNGEFFIQNKNSRKNKRWLCCGAMHKDGARLTQNDKGSVFRLLRKHSENVWLIQNKDSGLFIKVKYDAADGKEQPLHLHNSSGLSGQWKLVLRKV